MEHQHSVWQHVAGVAEFIAAKARLETTKFALHYMSLGFLLQVFEKLDENQDGGISLEEGLAMYRWKCQHGLFNSETLTKVGWCGGCLRRLARGPWELRSGDAAHVQQYGPQGGMCVSLPARHGGPRFDGFPARKCSFLCQRARVDMIVLSDVLQATRVVSIYLYAYIGSF